MKKTRKHSYTYIMTTAQGIELSLNAPNAQAAKIAVFASADPIISCKRVFKRGGELSRQIMKKSDIFKNW